MILTATLSLLVSPVLFAAAAHGQTLSSALPVLIPPARPPCVFGPYIIVFDTGSAELSKNTIWVLDNVVANYGSCGLMMNFQLKGYTDKRGLQSDRLIVSQNRVAAVKKHLIFRGAFPETIINDGYAEHNNQIMTTDGEIETDQDYVTIFFVPVD